MDKPKILIVEDDEFLRDLYLETLTEEGFQMETAADGNEGIAKIKQGNWDLILLDIILPQMSGLDIMNELKTKNEYPTTNKCLVFLTNLDKDEEIKQALQLGNGYLIKSQLTPGDLVKEVKMYLAKG